jgi:Glyoxalase-like domain
LARIRDVVFDCRHPASLARFWAATLDGYAVAPYDDAELERRRGQGMFAPEDDPTVLRRQHRDLAEALVSTGYRNPRV